MSVLESGEDGLFVAMPVWTPGSYLVREYARHVLDLSAVDDGGRSLGVRKVDKNTWHVATDGARVAHVDYVLYANERSVRTNHVDDSHAFLQPAASFLFVRGRETEPYAVSVDAPEEWEVFTGLRAEEGGWRAEDYDSLVDSPFEIGPHRVLAFDLDDAPFRIVLAGKGEVDEPKLQADVQRVVEEVAGIFGLVPFDDYTLILQLVDSGGGGLEHKNSSVCMVNRWKLRNEKDHRGLLSLIAHEVFHAWNVKRFRPESLGPFDYDRENYTRDLWVAEGVTSYYDDLSVLRAGFGDKVSGYLESRAGSFRDISRLPGAARTSLSRSSFDAWIKLYRPDENSSNSTVSYYSKGALVALLLDLRIRRLSDGGATLSDALRLGWDRYTKQGRGYPDGAMRELASEVAGADLGAFFDAYVDGTEPLLPDEDLAWVGLRLSVEPEDTDRDLAKDDAGFPLEPTLEIETADVGGLCNVSSVREGGAGERMGLNPGDRILSIDTMRVTHETLQDRLDRTRGEPIELVFYRGETLRRASGRPALSRLEKWKLLPVDSPGEAQAAAFKRWTHRDLPDPEGQDDAEQD